MFLATVKCKKLGPRVRNGSVLITVSSIGLLGQMCKKCTAEQKSKKYLEVPEWLAIVGNNQSGEFDHLSPEWSVLVSRIQYTQAGNV